MNRLIGTLIVIGVAMILLGIVMEIAEAYKEEICNNTYNIEWYINNCIKED